MIEHARDGKAPRSPQFTIGEGGTYPRRYRKEKLHCDACGKDVKHTRAYFGVDWDRGEEMAGRKCVECDGILVVFRVVLAGGGML